MKIKKILFLSMFLMMTLLFIPNIVNAEINLDGGATIELENIKLGGKGQETTYAIGGEHFTTPLINITWFESSNGSDYTLMDKDSKFDYNTYYKAVLDTSYDELNSMMDEDWELGGISIHIIDETGTTVDSKSGFRGNSELEYVFEPFWKYKIYLDLENMEYIGPSEIAEGIKFEAQLVPNKNYRLPNDTEIQDMRYIDISGENGQNHIGAYSKEHGIIDIDSWHIDSNIFIRAVAVEKKKIEFENNEYSYVKNNIKNSLEFTVPFQEDIDTIIIGEKVISNNDYFYEKTNDRLGIYDDFLDTLEVGTYVLRIENDNRYAETTFSVQELEVVDKITLDFREISNVNLFTEEQLTAFQFLGIDKGFLSPNIPLNAICDRNQKILFYIDEENNVILSEDLSHNDNIIYTLSEEDLENYKANYAYLKIPKTIEMIFAEDLVETYKVIFDANGGIFENENILTIEKWENGLESSLEQPIREGYTFKGYYTEKTGGTKLELILAESGIDKDMTFYAQWEENSSVSEGTPGIPEDEENNNNTENTNQENTNEENTNQENTNEENTNQENTNQENTNTDNNNTGADNNAEIGSNPQTGDNIILFVAILLVAIVGIIITTKVSKNIKNN